MQPCPKGPPVILEAASGSAASSSHVRSRRSSSYLNYYIQDVIPGGGHTSCHKLGFWPKAADRPNQRCQKARSWG